MQLQKYKASVKENPKPTVGRAEPISRDGSREAATPANGHRRRHRRHHRQPVTIARGITTARGITVRGITVRRISVGSIGIGGVGIVGAVVTTLGSLSQPFPTSP